MRNHRTTAALAAVAAAVAILPVAAAHADPGDGNAVPPDRDNGGEYVVAFDPANAEQARHAIAAAGGVVEDVQGAVGLALVSADAGFAAAVTADAAVAGAVQNVSIGATRLGQAQVRATDRLTARDDAEARGGGTSQPNRHGRGIKRIDPLEDLQWNMAMIGATRDGAHRKATGRGVTVGVIDTGVDAFHPDIAPNFNFWLSRNFTYDRPAIDGPCDTPTCIDPPWVDEGGHGTHVAGIVGAARNGIGITGVAPNATIVNLRAGQDSGYFFFYETVSALLYAGDMGIDVVNMSFFTDPWLYNCESAEDYISGDVTPEQIAEQNMIRTAVLTAVKYAHDRGVTLVGSAGNSHYNLALPERVDDISPDYPPGAEQPRVVTNNCLDLPAEAPDVITVSAVGPSTAKADYSNYGLGSIEVAAPGGYFRDWFGTPMHRVPGNLVLSAYPFPVALEEELITEDGTPTDDFTISQCASPGHCAVWTYLQGTSMASPHVAGEAALVIQAHGRRGRSGYSLHPDQVAEIIARTATDTPCPVPNPYSYENVGRPADWTALCEGDDAYNGFYGEGIINAAAAVT